VSANLDLVRSLYAAWERGDWSSAEWAHPEIEYVLPDGPDPGHFKGIAEMAEAWRGRLSASAVGGRGTTMGYDSGTPFEIMAVR
jgi:ketosteroid isomerase-like protein